MVLCRWSSVNWKTGLNSIFGLLAVVGIFLLGQQRLPVYAQESRRVFHLQESWIGAVGWTPEGMLLVVAQDGVRIYDPADGALVKEQAISLEFAQRTNQLQPYVFSTTLSSDASTLFWWSLSDVDDALHITRLTDGETILFDPTHLPEETLRSVQSSYDGSVIAFSLRLFEPQEGGGTSAYRHYYGWSYNQPFIRVSVYDMRRQQILHEAEFFDGFLSYLLSPDGRWLVISHGGQPQNAETILVDLQSGESSVLVTSNLLLQDFSDDGTRFVGEFQGELYWWDLNGGFGQQVPQQPPANPRGASTISRVTFNTLSHIATLENDCKIRLRDLKTDQVADLTSICAFEMAFSPDGRFLAVNAAGNEVSIWDVSGMLPE